MDECRQRRHAEHQRSAKRPANLARPLLNQHTDYAAYAERGDAKNAKCRLGRREREQRDDGAAGEP